MESIIIEQMAGNAPLMLIVGYALWKLDKRLSKLETILKDQLT